MKITRPARKRTKPRRVTPAQRATWKRADERRKAEGIPKRHALPNKLDLTPLDLVQPDILEHIARRAALGYPEIALARSVGMTLPAFRAHCVAHPEFSDAIAEGRAAEEFHYVSNLRRMADDPDHPASSTANIFLLKARAQYSDRPDKARVTNQQNNFFTQLPQQQSLDDYVKSLPAAAPSLPSMPAVPAPSEDAT